MTMLEKLEPTPIDQHQISQIKTQLAALTAQVSELAGLVTGLISSEQQFTETANDDRGIVLQIGSQLRDLATRSERQTEAIERFSAAIEGVMTENRELRRTLDGVLKLLAAGADIGRVFQVVQV